MTKKKAHQLLAKYIENPALQEHCRKVALAMEAYAAKLEHDEATQTKWYITGLLHDLDWEKFPDEHPNKAINEILPQEAPGIDQEQLQAIAAHAPQRTNQQPQTQLDKYLFACDELSGFLDAVAKVRQSSERPTGFEDMKWSSVKKKLKNKAFAAGVPREDIEQGAQLINVPLNEHALFLVSVFQKNN